MYKASLIIAVSAIAGLVSAQIPSCAQSCITLPANCNGNPSCICTDQTWLSSLTCCVKANCDANDQQAALAYANTVCNPVSVTLASSAFATASCPSTASSSGTATSTGSAASSAASASSSAASRASSASSSAASAASSAASSASSVASSAIASATGNPADKLAANGMGVVAAILGAAAVL